MLNPLNFQPPRNFGAIEPEAATFENVRFVVLPVPYAATSQHGTTRDGPAAILAASAELEGFDRESGRGLSELGIHTTAEIEPVFSRPESMAVRVTEVVGEVLFAGKTPLLLGGEHSLTFGAVCAALKLDLAGDLTVVQLDARPNLHHEAHKTRWGRDSVARRLSELPGLRLVQVGLRTCSREEYSNVPPNVTQFWCEAMLANWHNALHQILAATGPQVYLSFDVSVCDPSWLPATAAPEPGGLSFYQVRDLLRMLCTQREVLALDCVELNGNDAASAAAVARLLYQTMGYINR